MTIADYYMILGIPKDSSTEEIKTAYRKLARIYHPDVNHDPSAKDKFISATEAYEFLLSYHEKTANDDEAYRQAMEDWQKYRQTKARRRATAYARARYQTFRKTSLYKSTRIFDGTSLIYGFIISVLIISGSIYGYNYRLHNPIGQEKPSFFAFLFILLMGIVFLGLSIVYMIIFIETSRKRKKKPNKN